MNSFIRFVLGNPLKFSNVGNHTQISRGILDLKIIAN